MKKLLIAAMLLAGAGCGMALDIVTPDFPTIQPYKMREQKKKVTLTPATYAIITSTPEGEQLKDVTWTSRAIYPNGMGGTQWTEVSGFVPSIIVNGNKMYIYAPITQLSEIAAAWIEGTISSDGTTVTFPTPQAYMLNGWDVLYATRLEADGTVNPSNLDIVFDYQDGQLLQTDGGVLALTNLEGGFYGYGDTDIFIDKINEDTVQLPEGLVAESYLLEFLKAGNENRQTALIAFDGTDVYISDPLGIENSWFKGTLSGTTVTVSTPQYVGSGSGFPMYVTTGKEIKTTQTDPMTGQPYEVIDYTVTPGADIVFSYDEATGRLSTDQLLLMNSGKDKRGNAYSAVMAPAYTPWTPVRTTPADPAIEYYFNLDDYAEFGLKGCLINFTIPSFGTDNTFIPQENLYYQICFDGKPLEFYGTTMIPYYGQFTDNSLGAAIQLSGDNYDEHTLQVTYNPKKTVSIQSFYDFDGEVLSSAIMEYELIDGELNGVDEMVADTISGVEYFDLTGKAVSPAEGSGIVIRVVRNADGTRKCEKVIF